MRISAGVRSFYSLGAPGHSRACAVSTFLNSGGRLTKGPMQGIEGLIIITRAVIYLKARL